MAQPSSVLSQTMQSISLAKIHEIEKQRDRYESRKNEVLSAAALHPDNIRERITQLLSGVKKLCDRQLTTDPQVLNIDLWLQQSSYDASIPSQMLRSYETLLRSKLEVQSRKLGMAHLWSRLVTEWMNSSTPMSAVPDSSSDTDDVDRQEKRLKELCDKFEEVVFTPLERDESRIEQYMRGLFSGDEAGRALESLRSWIRVNESILLKNREPFDRETLRWCVNGLLVEDLLSDEKQAILREFPKNPVVLDEIADVLNMRFADFDNWSWEAGEQGIPVLPRPQLNGKYRIWMDEDVLQAIFIHYVGMTNCVDLKSSLVNYLSLANSGNGLWNWGTIENVTIVDRIKVEYLRGARLDSIQKLPSNVRGLGRYRAYHNDGDAQEDGGEENNNQKNSGGVNIKQKLLRTLATETIVHRTLHGEAAVVQSDLQWYATGLPHTTIFTVMRFFGFSERIVSFYRKVLQAPLNVISTPGESLAGEPRIRQRGVPMAHAPEKLIGEMILFIMDLAVNKANGMLLYRLHDDLFLCGEPSRCAQAWEAMKEFADIMGVSFNKSKTGSVYLTNPEKSRDAEIESILPTGVVRIGHLLLDQDSGEWVMDQDQIGEHVTQLRKQLAACNNILDWVKTWNSCISRFFSHTLGEPAYCFGIKHVDSVLEIYQGINRVLFRPSSSSSSENDEGQPRPEGNVVDYLKSKIEERFGVSDVPDVFIFLPEIMGGLGVKNPFIPYLAFRNCFLENKSESSPDSIMRVYRASVSSGESPGDSQDGIKKRRITDSIVTVAKEKDEYDIARKAFAKLDGGERLMRLRKLYPQPSEAYLASQVLSKVLTPGQDDDFWSFEDYTRHREWTSGFLTRAYNILLDVPIQKGADVESFATRALARAGIKGEAKVLQVEWVLQLYQDELKERWGGSRLVDKKYLPLGLLTMMRRKAVRWTMVLLPSIPMTDHATVPTNLISSHRPSSQHGSEISSTNPFKLIPPAYRPILTTLHVLYPSTLLPALDLLDRRLVTRVILKRDSASHPPRMQTGRDLTIISDQEAQAGGESSNIPEEQDGSGAPPLYHLVRSAQPQSHRRRHSTSAGGQVYIVRLESWNCTCAAFSFSAFPPLPSSTFSSPGPTVDGYQILPASTSREEDTKLRDAESGENAEQAWEFGGLSADGRDGTGGVPCCKHLLACVLAEKWNGVLGGYMEERLVGREEAAGLVGDL
ncbi:hypothetical protein EKO27_g3456 [Xylaria grammica]|uniref:Reverse transcriptase domain-containing protein n=1 Tax=Xylaria grammica TaxID=363999 RepID=A0A439DB78_9PEZI|nr:hypothetical protein EKO27_g3456 [Xylaria grammica]